MSLKAKELFDRMVPHIEKYGAEVVKKVQSVYAFEIRAKKGAKPTTWTIDLKNDSGSITEGKKQGVKPDCTFVMFDDDFIALSQGKIKP